MSEQHRHEWIDASLGIMCSDPSCRSNWEGLDAAEANELEEQVAVLRAENAALREALRIACDWLGFSTAGVQRVTAAEWKEAHGSGWDDDRVRAEIMPLLADPSPAVRYLLTCRSVMDYLDSLDLEISYETEKQRDEAIQRWANYRAAKATLEGQGVRDDGNN